MKPFRSLRPRPRLATLVLAGSIATLLVGSSGPAASPSIWDGGGADDLWTNAANWGGNVPVPGTSYALQFSGTTQLTPSNNFTALSNFGSVMFNAGAGAFVIGGNSITVNGNITNNSGSVQTINNALTFTNNAHVFTTPAGGDLVLGGLFTGGTANTFSLVKNGAGTLTLGLGVNTTKGGVILNGGTLDLGAGGIRTESNTGSAFLATTNATVNATGGGRITLDSGSIGFAANPGMTLTVNATIQNGFQSFFSINGNAAGTVVLGGANIFTGIVNMQSGTTSVSTIGNTGTAGNMGTGAAAITFATNGTAVLKYTGAGETHNRNVIINGGATGSATLEQGAASGLWKFVGNVTGSVAGTHVITLQGSTAGTGEIAGAIDNAGGTAQVTKAGTGTWTLSGANTFTGATTVAGGTLKLDGNSGSLNGATGTALTFNANGGTFHFDNTTSAAVAELQNMGVLTFSAGEGIVQSTLGGASSATLAFGSLARTPGGAGNFVITGGSNGTDQFITIAGQPAGFINQGSYFGGANFASMHATGTYVRALNYGVDPNTAPVDTITAGQHVKLTATPAAQDSISLPTLNLAGGGTSFALNAGHALTLSGGGLIKSGGGAASTISGGTAVTTGATEFVVRTDTAADALVISTNLTSGNTAGVTKSGMGTLTLSGANSYTGGTFVTGGVLKVGSAGALGAFANTLTVNGVNSVVDLNGLNITVANLAGNGGAIDNTATGTTAQITLNSGTNTYRGALQNTGAGSTLNLRVNNGTITLAGPNTYSGTTTLNGGTLTLTGANTTTGAFTINGGTTLELSSNGALGTSALTINGGALDSKSNAVLSGVNVQTWNGDFTFLGNGSLTFGTGAISLGTAAGTTRSFQINASTLTQNGVISNGATVNSLLKGGNGTLALNGNNLFTGSVTVIGGTLVLGGTNAYTGATNVNGGTLSLGSSALATGSIANTASLNINQVGALQFNNSAGDLNNLGAGQPVILNQKATLLVTGNPITDGTETVGAITLNGGDQTITIASSAGRITTLAASTLTRNHFATALVRGTSLNQSVITNVSRFLLGDGVAALIANGFGTNTLNGEGISDATQAVKILPYLIGDTSVSGTGSHFVTYDSALGLRVLTTAQETQLAAGSTTAANPVNAIAFNGTITSATGITVNSLIFNGSQTLNGNAAGILTILSGALATTTNNAAVIGGFASVALGNEGFLHVTQSTLAINRPISVASGGGLTKAGAGTATLGAVNTYTGATTVNQGILQATVANVLNGTTGTDLVVNAGSFNLNGQPQAVKALVLRNNGTVTGSSTLTLGGNAAYDGAGHGTGATIGSTTLNLNGTRTFDVSDSVNSTNELNITAVIADGSVASGFTKTGAGTVTLTATNTFTGTTTINAGRFIESTGNNLAGGPLTVDGQTAIFDLGDSHSDTVGTVTLANGGTIVGINSSALTTTGTFELKSGSVTAILAGGSTIPVNKTTADTVILSGTNTYTGVTTISGGTLRFTKPGALYNSTQSNWVPAKITVATGATLAVNIGGSGEFSTANVATLLDGAHLGAATASTGLQANAAVGFDTTNAVGAVTYGTVIANTTGTVNAVGVTKLGTGTLILSNAANTYTGATNVNGGALLVSGSIAGSATTVNAGGQLAGNGSTGAVVVLAGGTFAPSNGTSAAAGSLGQIDTGALSIAAGTAKLSIDLGKTSLSAPVGGTDYDQVSVAGTVTLAGGDLALTIATGTAANIVQNDLFFLVINDLADAIAGAGAFATINGSAYNPAGFTVGGATFEISYTADSVGGTFTGGNDIAIQAIPEPASALTLLSGLGGLLGLRRIRRRDRV